MGHKRQIHRGVNFAKGYYAGRGQCEFMTNTFTGEVVTGD